MTFTMENGNLRLEDVDVIEKGVQSLLDCVRNEINHMNSISPSIYMVPGVIRDLSPSSFSPRVVCIGPLHKKDENVQAFEKRKTSFLINLMSRIDSPQQEILRSCMEKAHALMERIRKYYIWTENYDDVEVAKMMVMDACFILESIYWCTGSDKSYSGTNLPAETVMTDMIMLENQIPLFFLDEIYKCTIQNYSNLSLVEFLYPLLDYFNFFDESLKIHNISVNTSHHILGLLHECYKPQDNIKPIQSTPSSIHSAIDLDKAGVNFKPYKDPTWLMMMKVKPYRFPYFFGSWGKPTLKMPVFVVSDTTELVLRNLITYEQSCQSSHHIASYVWAMDMLVDSKEDVAKLVDSRVLINHMGSNEEVANIINNIGNGLVLARFFYVEQCKTLYDYYNGYWPKHIAWLRRTYFNSPWNIIALFAGIILFALTVIQTIFTIKSTGSNK